MTQYLENMLRAMRPAFSRKAVFVWFVVAVAGIATRSDVLGVTSTVRALWLASACHPCLPHFFHLEAWAAGSLMRHWWKWPDAEGAAPEDRASTAPNAIPKRPSRLSSSAT